MVSRLPTLQYEPSEALRGLSEAERMMRVADYFAQFAWIPVQLDPHKMTPEEFFTALDEAPSTEI